MIEDEEKKNNGGEKVSPDNKTYKVLILDDDDFLLQMYALKFKKSSFEVDIAKNGLEAIEKIKAQKDFDAVLVDVVLPEMDGFEFIEQVKKENLAPNTAFIMLTNQGQPSDIDKGKSLKVDGYIVKASAVPSEVVARVREILDDFVK